MPACLQVGQGDHHSLLTNAHTSRRRGDPRKRCGIRGTGGEKQTTEHQPRGKTLQIRTSSITAAKRTDRYTVEVVNNRIAWLGSR